MTFELFMVSIYVPSIAQLVERRSVGDELISLVRWFEFGSKESFSFFLTSPTAREFHFQSILFEYT